MKLRHARLQIYSEYCERVVANQCKGGARNLRLAYMFIGATTEFLSEYIRLPRWQMRR